MYRWIVRLVEREVLHIGTDHSESKTTTRTLHARFPGNAKAVRALLRQAALSTGRSGLAESRSNRDEPDIRYRFPSETTTSPNAFSMQLFENGNVVLSPVDRWTFELPLADNPWFMSVSPSDVPEFDGDELADAILSLEFLCPQ